MNKRKQQIPMLDFRAGFVPKSYNEEKRTVDVIWTTGSKVLRSPWWGEAYYEELQVDDKSIRLDRLNSGAPLLNNHSSYSLQDIIGVVESARVENGQGYATVRLSERPEIAGLVKDIKDGIIRNISVGYAVHKYEKVSSPEGTQMADETPTYRATDWEPMELSFVGIPADAKAQSRNQTALFECEIINNKNERGEAMEPKEILDDVATPSEVTEAVTTPTTEVENGDNVVDAAPVDALPSVQEGERNQKTKDEVQALEMKRQDEIRKAVRTAKLDESFADGLVKKADLTIDQARAAIFAELEKRTSTATNNIRIDGGTMDQQTQRREAATRILLNQFDNKFKTENGDGEFRAHGILGMARRILEMEGVRGAAFMSPSEVAKRSMHHTSDFVAVLENVANKSLRAAYEAAPNTYAPFVKTRNVADFKEISSVSISAGSKLEKLNEHGEVKSGTLLESKEKYKVETFGRIVGLTRQAIINDDLGAFTAIPAGLGLRARQKENEIFWQMILTNKVMAETGLSLFNAGHKNLAAAGTVIDIAAIGKARAAMKSMLDLDKQPINVSPSFLVVPTALETLADQFVSQITPNQSGQVNPFANRLQVIAEPYLDVISGAVPWYVFGQASAIAMAEMALLDGQGPRIEVRQGFEIEGAETKIVYDFGMTLLDYRGFYKNPGVV